MPTLEEVAPELSQVIDQSQAETFGDTSVGGASPPAEVNDITSLSATKRDALLLWLKWFKARTVPSTIPELETYFPNSGMSLAQLTKWFLRLSPKIVAKKLNLNLAYLRQLIQEVIAIRAELAREEDAWMPTPVTPVITGAAVGLPSVGDLTIYGTEFDSYATKTTYVRINRPGVGSVTRSQADIETAGGSVTSTQIVVPASIIPAGGPQSGDEVTVRADGLDSSTYVIEA